MDSKDNFRSQPADGTKNLEGTLPGGIARKTFRIKNWKTWDDEVHASVRAFNEEFFLYPDIFLAGGRTLDRIDTAAKILHLERFTNRETGMSPDSPPESGIGVFAGEDYSLEFCVDDGMPDGEFALIYDPDPDWDEPPPESAGDAKK